MSDDIDDIRDALREEVAKTYNALPGVGQPVYAHDCTACVFLGRYEAHDLYFCGKREAPEFATVIARFGNDGPEYCSGLDFGIRPLAETASSFSRVMRVAYLIAADAGLVAWMSPTGRTTDGPWPASSPGSGTATVGGWDKITVDVPERKKW